MRRRLTGEVALVTGASSGIGAATAREFARQGAKVVLAARRTDELQRQAQSIEAAGGQAIAVSTDVTDADQVRRLFARARDVFGHVDILINNAGAIWLKRLSNTSAAEIEEILNTNLLGTMLVTQAALPEMIARHHGAIVSVSSVAGRIAIEPLYSATKFGVRGYSLALRRQLSRAGISVSVVEPGNIRTAMTAGMSDGLPGPEIVAKAIADLVVHPRRELIVPQRHYLLAWIEQLAPDVADFLHQKRHWSRAS
ncbi:MAG TPA: SDR family oxidoreductase [Ktedonobacterales bacterium]|nr:SDR family oxidoreductase [Ktedonobacterales bacterium]